VKAGCVNHESFVLPFDGGVSSYSNSICISLALLSVGISSIASV